MALMANIGAARFFRQNAGDRHILTYFLLKRQNLNGAYTVGTCGEQHAECIALGNLE